MTRIEKEILHWTKTADGLPGKNKKVLVVDCRGAYHVWSASVIGGTAVWEDDHGCYHYAGDVVKWAELKEETPAPAADSPSHICAECSGFYRSAWKEPCCSIHHVILPGQADRKYCGRM